VRSPSGADHNRPMTTAGSDRGQQPTLTGEQVRLRPWRRDDVDAIVAACQDPELQRWTQVPVPYRREDAEGFVAGIASGTWAAGGALFAVEPRDGGPLLASIGLFPASDGFAEAGYWTVAEHRGRGYTTEALGVLADWVFGHLGLRRLELHVDPANVGSRRVAERAGFVAEGLVRQRFLHRGHPSDVLLYARLGGSGAASRGTPSAV
jgi:RimJ/RimL family protein N-acetyltransferase